MSETKKEILNKFDEYFEKARFEDLLHYLLKNVKENRIPLALEDEIRDILGQIKSNQADYNKGVMSEGEWSLSKSKSRERIVALKKRLREEDSSNKGCTQGNLLELMIYVVLIILAHVYIFYSQMSPKLNPFIDGTRFYEGFNEVTFLIYPLVGRFTLATILISLVSIIISLIWLERTCIYLPLTLFKHLHYQPEKYKAALNLIQVFGVLWISYVFGIKDVVGDIILSLIK